MCKWLSSRSSRRLGKRGRQRRHRRPYDKIARRVVKSDGRKHFPSTAYTGQGGVGGCLPVLYFSHRPSFSGEYSKPLLPTWHAKSLSPHLVRVTKHPQVRNWYAYVHVPSLPDSSLPRLARPRDPTLLSTPPDLNYAICSRATDDIQA
jgi:hypothetical protein